MSDGEVDVLKTTTSDAGPLDLREIARFDHSVYGCALFARKFATQPLEFLAQRSSIAGCSFDAAAEGQWQN
jgi:hypothetical protein